MTTRNAVIHAYANAISKIWLVNTPICGVGFIMSQCDLDTLNFHSLTHAFPVLFVRAYSLKRTVVRSGDVEKGKTEDPVVADTPTKDDDEKKSIREISRADANERDDDTVTERTHTGDATEADKSKM